ncbi:nSTAND1 domain-containing NTPase [Saccharothrix stipae]
MDGRTVDPDRAADQAEFRGLLRELMQVSGHGSLNQLQIAAQRNGVHLPVSTADRALNADRLPTADFVRRFVRACGRDPEPWIAAREKIADRKYARTPRPAPGTTTVPCPYPGLSAFDVDQEKWFHGREAVITELLRQLTFRLSGGGPLAVVAPSGTGKSSLLRAGLVPAVARGAFPGSEDWPAVVCTPTAHPAAELARRLSDVTAERYLLVVDQFEETFTLCADHGERAAFVADLCARADAGAVVVLGLRADFYGHCAGYPELVRSVRGGQVLLGAMTADELRDAIGRPADAAGLRLEPGLADVLLADLGVRDGVGYEPGALPLLAHALFVTWQHRRERVLTIEGYRRAGGIDGAIATTAEHAYLGLDEPGRDIARRLLLRLVVVGDGSDDTRRGVDREALVSETADPELASAVVETLTRARLLTQDERVVEMTHEALLRCWPRLRTWIDDGRAALVVRQRLADAADAWRREGRPPDSLHRGPRLAAVREWVDPGDPDLPVSSREFLAASVEHEQAERAAVRRRTRRLRQFAGALAALVVLAATATVFAVRSEQDATRQRNEALARGAAAEATAIRAANPALAAQLGLAAYRVAAGPESRGSLLSTSANPYAARITGHRNFVFDVRFSPDGATLATASGDRTVRLWDARDPFRPVETAVLDGHEDNVLGTAFTPDGTLLLTCGADRTVRLWDVATRRSLAVLAGHTEAVRDIAISPDGRVVASASYDGTVRLWDLSSRAGIAVLTGHAGGVGAVAFSPDATLLATGGNDGLVRLWDVATRRETAVLTDHGAPVLSVAFSPDGRTLASGAFDNTVRLWNVTGRPTAVLDGHANGVIALAFSPDGTTLATGGYDMSIRLWHLADGSPLLTLTGHSETVYSLAFSPDGRTLASSSRDNTAKLWALGGAMLTGPVTGFLSVAHRPDGRVLASGGIKDIGLWDVGDPRRPRLLGVGRGHTDGVHGLAFSADGRTLATSSLDYTARLWDVADPAAPREIAVLRGHTDNVTSVALSPDGRTLATAGADASLRLWDVPTRRELAAVPLTADVTSVVFTPDGRRLVSGGDDRLVRLWDVTDPGRPREEAVFTGHTDGVRAVAVTSDGSLVASGGYDRTARVWDLASGRETAVFTGHTDRVVGVAFSPDGRTLATAAFDRTARLWDVPTRTPSAVLSGHAERLFAVAFSPDGRTVATAGADRTARLWDVDPVSAAALTCARAHPRLTEEEWRRFFPDLRFEQPC